MVDHGQRDVGGRRRVERHRQVRGRCVALLLVVSQGGVEEVDVARRQPDRLDLAELVARQRRHDASQVRERLVERLRPRALPLVCRRTRRRRQRRRRGHVTRSGEVAGTVVVAGAL